MDKALDMAVEFFLQENLVIDEVEEKVYIRISQFL